MKKLPISLLILVVLIAFGLIFQKELVTHLKIALFITEEFPQIPIKPLGLLTANPKHQKVELETSNGTVVADLYIPNQILRLPLVAQDKAAALILAMGVKTSDKDKPLLFHFANTMARLGYVTFWPRLEVLDKGQSLPEEPETFIEAFKFVSGLPQTDSKRITFVGFSVGSSTAFVAASDPEITQQAYGLVFFGGQFDVFQYLLSLATKSIIMNGSQIPWDPDLDAINHAKSLLEAKGADQVLKMFDVKQATEAAQLLSQAPEDEILGLRRYSPKERVNQFKAKIFILHDKSDSLVPYVESVKLNKALTKDQIGEYLLIDLFEHVQPNRPIKFGELVKLYGFLYEVLSFI